jgi:hypothetical protein
MKFLKIVTVIVLSSIVLQSCKENKEYKKIETAPIQATNTIHEIVVNEVVDGGGYTYLNVKEGDKNYWMAITSANVEVGKTYYYSGGMEMKDFESKQLEKTFDYITFAENVSNSKESLQSAKNMNPHEPVTKPKESKMIAKLAKKEGAIFLEEIFNNKSDFANKEVEVTGVVVKVNKNILDKNWIHIIDGTKTETNSSLAITSNELVKVGDTVTVSGKIVLDKDFGYGYVYNILLEEGKFK